MAIWQTKVGLALGGGAAKGAAHIGVLRALQQQNITLDAIAGTSVGAIIASLYAFGKTTDDIAEIARELNLSRISGFTLRKKGFSTSERLENILLEQLGDVQIQQAQIPLALVASNIRTGEKKIFTEGSVARAVAASAAIPGFFVPVEIDGEEYVDGGLLENVPISALTELGAKATIAAFLNQGEGYPAPQGILDVVSNALDIAINSKTIVQLRKADVVIDMNLRDFSRTDNRERTDELIDAGYQLAMAKKTQLAWCKYPKAVRSVLQTHCKIKYRLAQRKLNK